MNGSKFLSKVRINKTEEHSTFIPLQYPIPYSFGTALKSMHFLCIFVHNYFYKMYFLTKNSNLLVFRDTFLDIILKNRHICKFLSKNDFFVLQKNYGNNTFKLQFSPTKNDIILIFWAKNKRILLELSKNVRKAPLY